MPDSEASDPAAPEFDGTDAPAREGLDALLLDMLAGWAEYVEACIELAELPREQFEAEYFGDEPVEPDVYESWKAHYTRDYLDAVEALEETAETLVLDFAGEGGAMTPAEFLEQEVVPLFRHPGERESDD